MVSFCAVDWFSEMLPIAYRGQPRYVQKSFESSNPTVCLSHFAKPSLARIAVPRLHCDAYSKGNNLVRIFRRVATRRPYVNAVSSWKKIKHISILLCHNKIFLRLSINFFLYEINIIDKICRKVTNSR